MPRSQAILRQIDLPNKFARINASHQTMDPPQRWSVYGQTNDRSQKLWSWKYERRLYLYAVTYNERSAMIDRIIQCRQSQLI